MKNKYKISFSVFNLFTDTQAEVVKLQTYIKGIFGAAIATTWISSNATYAAILAISAGAVDGLLACFNFEKIQQS